MACTLDSNTQAAGAMSLKTTQTTGLTPQSQTLGHLDHSLALPVGVECLGPEDLVVEQGCARPPHAAVTCLSVRGLAFSLEVPISQTHTTVLVPPVMTSLGLGHTAQRIWPHSDRHS